MTPLTDEQLYDDLEYWRDFDGIWLTDFPPPADFDGTESGKWGEYGYNRECTAAEQAMLNRGNARAEATERGHAERLRDKWLADIQSDPVDQPDLPPDPLPA